MRGQGAGRLSSNYARKHELTAFAGARGALLAGALALSGCPGTEAPDEVSGCRRDTDCKGDRICEAGACVAPRPNVGAGAAAEATAGPAAEHVVTPGWTRGGPGRPYQALGTGP